MGNTSVTTVTLDGKPVESLAGLYTSPQLALPDLKVSGYNLILMPGGDGIEEVMNDSLLGSLLLRAKSAGVPIASICSSAALLGKSGLLKGRKFTCTPETYEEYKEEFKEARYTGEDIEVETKLITAKGTAFAEFAISVGKELSIWRDSEHANRAYKFCKGMV